LEVHVSNFVLDATHYQHGEDGQFHPIALSSQMIFATKIKYEIYDKELLVLKNGTIYLKTAIPKQFSNI
jgi:hypothetical protein